MSVSFPFLFCDQRIEGETKTAKSWRHPLSKPPARSPLTLVKQQAISDEGEFVMFCSVYSVYTMWYAAFILFVITDLSKNCLVEKKFDQIVKIYIRKS